MSKQSQGFEQKIEEAKKIIDRLMDPEITLEESIKLYEQGIKRIKEAQVMIEEAKLKVETIEQRIWQQSEASKQDE